MTKTLILIILIRGQEYHVSPYTSLTDGRTFVITQVASS